MPMIPQAAIAMLACARLGAVHSVVFGGFAPHELAIRIDDAKPKVIVTASGAMEGKKTLEYKPMVDKAIEQAAHKPEKCHHLSAADFVKASLIPGRDLDWEELMAKQSPLAALRSKPRTRSTSCIPRARRENRKALCATTAAMRLHCAGACEYIYGVEPGDVYWAASDVGWVVGHSYIVYAPLLHGCTTILYEGNPSGTPDAGAFWRVISAARRKVLFTAPTAFRAIKKEDPNGEFIKKYDLSGFKYLFLAGERLDPDTYHWAHDLLKKPVIDHWWQTETGWPITANCMGIEELHDQAGLVHQAGARVRCHASSTRNGKQAGAERGQALSPSSFRSLRERFPRYGRRTSGFWSPISRSIPGYYFTSDGGYIDEDGYVFIMGRVDDVINVAGHRLSTGEMEEVVSTHKDIAECAVIGVHDNLKGQLPVGLCVLKAGVNTSEEAIQEGSCEDDPGNDRTHCRVQGNLRGETASEDAFREDPARHHAENRGRRNLYHAVDDRRPGHARRDRGSVEEGRLCA